MYQKGYHNTNVAIHVSSQRAAFASYIFFFDPAYNFVLYDRNYPWTYTSFHIFTNISQHSLFSFWVILSDFSDIVNLFYYDLTIVSAATVWSCRRAFYCIGDFIEIFYKKVSSTLQLPCPSFLRGGFLFLSFSFIIESWISYKRSLQIIMKKLNILFIPELLR